MTGLFLFGLPEVFGEEAEIILFLSVVVELMLPDF
jgi:hypothetical protein